MKDLFDHAIGYSVIKLLLEERIGPMCSNMWRTQKPSFGPTTDNEENNCRINY